MFLTVDKEGNVDEFKDFDTYIRDHYETAVNWVTDMVCGISFNGGNYTVYAADEVYDCFRDFIYNNKLESPHDE